MDIDLVSFNSLLKRIVDLCLSITNPESVQVFSLGQPTKPEDHEEYQQCEAVAAEQTSTSTIAVNIDGNDIEVEHGLGLSLSDDSSSEESDEDTDSEDDPEMQLFVSQLLNQAEQLASGGVTELFECLLKVKECFAQEGRGNQELLASQLVHPDQEGSLEEIYALCFNLFEGKSVCIGILTSIYNCTIQPPRVYHARMI